MHPGIFVIAVYLLFYYGAILIAVMLPISWLLRTRPGSPFRVVGFLLTALAGVGAFGCGFYWWALASKGPPREGIPLQIGSVLSWIAAFAFGWLFLYGLGTDIKPPPPSDSRTSR